MSHDDPYRDELGLSAPIPASHGQRCVPEDGFYTGPAVGERLPDFELPAASGATVAFHADRGDSRAAVVFLRSAVW